MSGRGKVSIAFDVALTLQRVIRTIDLDDKSTPAANEVEDNLADRMLRTKSRTIEPTALQA